MAANFARLQRIEDREPLPGETQDAFRHHLQLALLLALREQGRLTALQYRRALEAASRKHRKQEVP